MLCGNLCVYNYILVIMNDFLRANTGIYKNQIQTDLDITVFARRTNKYRC